MKCSNCGNSINSISNYGNDEKPLCYSCMSASQPVTPSPSPLKIFGISVKAYFVSVIIILFIGVIGFEYLENRRVLNTLFTSFFFPCKGIVIGNGRESSYNGFLMGRETLVSRRIFGNSVIKYLNIPRSDSSAYLYGHRIEKSRFSFRPNKVGKPPFRWNGDWEDMLFAESLLVSPLDSIRAKKLAHTALRYLKRELPSSNPMYGRPYAYKENIFLDTGSSLYKRAKNGYFRRIGFNYLNSMLDSLSWDFRKNGPNDAGLHYQNRTICSFTKHNEKWKLNSSEWYYHLDSTGVLAAASKTAFLSSLLLSSF